MSEHHHAIEIHSVEQFNHIMSEAGSKPLVIDFTASWCPPCQMIKPIFEQLAKDYEGKAVLVKVDVDEMDVLAAEFGINCMPTFKIVKGGQVVDQLEGASKDGLVQLIQKHL